MRAIVGLLTALLLGMACQHRALAIEADVSKAIPEKAAQAQNQARIAQKLAILASRKALKVAETARDASVQAVVAAPAYIATTTAQGFHYEGQWLNKPPKIIYHGYGVLSWPNGNRYEGKFQYGHKNGLGVFTGGNGDRYQGEWRMGDINGYGIYIYPDGYYYFGEFVNESRQGYGVLYYPNGDRYEGQWRDNEKSGYGILSSANNTVLFAGEW